MKLVLMGTNDFVVPMFDAILNAGHEIMAVFTRAPRPAGRKQILTPSPVNIWADAKNLPVYTNIRDYNFTPDMIVVVSYGVILRDNVLNSAPCVNIHPSCLPKYRGPSPIRTAIFNGDTKSEYQITGQDGKIISRQRASRKQIDDNHYITTKNGVSYDVQFTENQVIVTKIKNGELSSEQVTFKIGNAGEDDVIFDKTLTPMLKQLSGDEFFAIKKNDIQKIVMDNKVRGNAYWNKFDKKLVVSPELQDKLSVLKHELGHSKDMPGYLEEVIDLKKQRMTVNDGTALYSHNQKFNKVFADELKEFDEKAAISEKVALDYFISQRPFSSSGTFEVLAEANALQSSIQDLPVIAERTVNLERHFPKSLAQAFEYLNQTAKKIKGYVIKDNDSPYLHS